MTVEEALAASVVEPVNDIFEIDPETRVITVPASEKLFGVANDWNSERKHFRCPKIVGNNIDLSTMHLYVNYQNANGQKYPYLVEDIRTDGDYITFSWLIGPDVVAYKGQIKFIVCAKKRHRVRVEYHSCRRSRPGRNGSHRRGSKQKSGHHRTNPNSPRQCYRNPTGKGIKCSRGVYGKKSNQHS